MELTAHREETDAKQVIKQICSMSDGDRRMQKNNNMRINVRGGELECWKKIFFKAASNVWHLEVLCT